jgi:hypothetical protein
MHMKLHLWKTVGGLLFCISASALASAGCSTSSTSSGGNGGGSGGGSGSGGTVITPTISGCTDDPTVTAVCTGGSEGFSCDQGDNPELEDTTDSLSCSTPTANGGEDDFCCFVFSGGSASTCVADDDLTSQCPDADSFGYQCADPTDDPTSLDGSLNCSDGVADGSSTDFCCSLTGTGSGSGGTSSGGETLAGCTQASVGCSGDAIGYACGSGDNPEDEDSTLSCSVPTSSAGEDDFCCFAWTPGDSTCTPDDELTSQCPDADSYGYQCDDPTDDPTSLDSSLNCSDGVADGSSTDFCCSLN